MYVFTGTRTAMACTAMVMHAYHGHVCTGMRTPARPWQHPFIGHASAETSVRL